MYVLSLDKQSEIVAALVDGCSIRATERISGTHRDTIMRLGVRVGERCAALHDRLMREIHVSRIECDEIWSFVGKKQKQLKPGEAFAKGDQYLFIALDATRKAILSYAVGKRDQGTTLMFMADLHDRIIGIPQISTDAFRQYRDAIDETFGIDVHYGQIIKQYAGESGMTAQAARRYSPGEVVAVRKRALVGQPEHGLISTSYVERSNLSIRMNMRRFTRLTNGFSKNRRNHCAAVSLYVMHYNFCRVHETLRITPAMQLGISDHVWTIGELVNSALSGTNEPPKGLRQFTVIDGGAQ
jgi:IS1 family transposase